MTMDIKITDKAQNVIKEQLKQHTAENKVLRILIKSFG
jgi:Fe-S cluster assembly iron-binding protein IscA